MNTSPTPFTFKVDESCYNNKIEPNLRKIINNYNIVKSRMDEAYKTLYRSDEELHEAEDKYRKDEVSKIVERKKTRLSEAENKIRHGSIFLLPFRGHLLKKEKRKINHQYHSEMDDFLFTFSCFKPGRIRYEDLKGLDWKISLNDKPYQYLSSNSTIDTILHYFDCINKHNVWADDIKIMDDLEDNLIPLINEVLSFGENISNFPEDGIYLYLKLASLVDNPCKQIKAMESVDELLTKFINDIRSRYGNLTMCA